ncbi:MAG: MOSC domain-containing protein [Chitinophagaceae bacterium]|jgi:uncharacterized protein YcbX
MFTISQLFIYPVKSLRGIAVDHLTITDRGAQYDRRWMLVDPFGGFVTIRQYPEMTRLRTSIEGDALIIYDAKDPSDRISTPLHPTPGQLFSGKPCLMQVQVWDDVVSAWFCEPSVSNWISDKLGQLVVLVYMPDESLRPVDPVYAPTGAITSFTDGYPLLIIGQSSLDDLNSRLDNPVDMRRFRPNIVFTGGAPFAEDQFAAFHIANVPILGVKRCARCVVTTTHPETGEIGPEPLRTLATYRRHGNKVDFGMNLVATGIGEIRIGDEIRLSVAVSGDA